MAISVGEKRFVELIGPKAIKDFKTCGLLPSITIAQACLECGFGTSELAVNANNFFGMKTNLSGRNWASCWDGTSKYNKVTAEQNADGVTYHNYAADFRKYPSMDKGIEDHSLYLINAKNGVNLRYEGIVGESNFNKVAQLIKDGGYATSSTYVNKLNMLYNRLGLAHYDLLAKQQIKYTQNFMKKSPYYTNPTYMEVKGLMLHSTGHAQPNAMNYFNYWNSPTFDSQCVHGLIDGNNGKIYQILPWNYQAAHCGKGTSGQSANRTHISIEMCEPAELKYTGNFTFTCSNIEKARASVTRSYNQAVVLFADLCGMFNLNPLMSGVIISHKEGYQRGVASNHEDPEHLWRGLGLPYTMDGFRQDVYKAMKNQPIEIPSASIPESAISVLPTPPFQVRVLIDDLNYRKMPLMGNQYIEGVTKKGVFTIVETKDDEWGKLKSGVGWIYLRNPEYCQIIQTEQKKEETKETFTQYSVRIMDDALNFRKGPGIEYAINGTIRDRGIYTIVEEKNGWGRLKSGAGWINLYYTKKL